MNTFDKRKEMLTLVKEIEPMLNNFSELTKNEIDQCGKKILKVQLLNQQITNEIEALSNKNADQLTVLGGKLVEYENAIGIMEAFISEHGLYEDFLVFAEQLIQDFMKDQKPNLTLVQ